MFGTTLLLAGRENTFVVVTEVHTRAVYRRGYPTYGTQGGIYTRMYTTHHTQGGSPPLMISLLFLAQQ